MISVTLSKTLILGFHFSKFLCCNPTTFQKSSTAVLFWVRQTFSELTKILLLVNSSEKLREGVEGQELQWNCKRYQSKPLRKLCCRHFYGILKQFCPNGVSMSICQLLRLLRYRKLVGYKVESSIPNPGILKEGEVLANEDCWVN